MFVARQLAFSASLIVLGVVIGCTGSEPYVPPMPGSGGATGSGTGGMMAGTGGMMAGTGGMMAGTGGMMAGTGGMMTGTGGAKMDAAADTPRTDGGGMEAAGGMLTFAKDVGPLLMMRCGTCHGAAGGLMVNSLTSVKGATTTNCAMNVSKMRIVPNNPAMSFLYLKVSTPTAMLTGCGNQMPRNGPPYLTTAEQTTIRTWIMQGAN